MMGSLHSSFSQDWFIKGSETEGALANHRYGYNVAMSGDGRTFIASSNFTQYNGTNTGHADIKRYIGGNWVALGSRITGLNNEYLGDDVSINQDGSIIAVSSKNGASGRGVIRVYQYVGNNWVQLGASITGITIGDYSGDALSLSDDGYTIAIGERSVGLGGNTLVGRVRVFKYSNGVWVQEGNSLTGTSGGDYFGHSVSLSASGDTLSIGSLGAYLVKTYINNGGSWTQLGNTLTGSTSDFFGASVSLSDNGQSLAIGEPFGGASTAGRVWVYRLINGNWVTVGSPMPLNGISLNDFFGGSVSINNSGSRIVIGSNGYNGSAGNNTGRVSVYELRFGDWFLMGSHIEGGFADDELGSAVAFDDAGESFVVAAQYYDGISGASTGKVSVYNFCSTTYASITTTSCGDYTSPSGKIITSSSVFNDTITNSKWCDSVITINLTINSNSTSTLSPAVCNAYTSPSGNYTWNVSGNYKDTIPNAAGCDSIININLTVNATYSTIDTTVCDSYITPSGYLKNSTGIFNDTISNGQGCDSIITIDLTVNQTTFGNFSVTVCDSFVSPSGNIWKNSGLYTDVIQNQSGCDSIIDIILTVNSSTFSTIDTIVCDSYITPGGFLKNTTGVFNDTISNSNGCDSIITIDLTVNETTYASISPAACDSFISPSGNIWYSSGLYTDVIPNANGCDSIISVNLTVVETPQISNNNGILETVNYTNTSYQWLDCNNNYAVISGATSNTFTPSSMGSYAVLTIRANCIDTSACYAYNTTAMLNNKKNLKDLKVYPNPTNGEVKISHPLSNESLMIYQFNIAGELIHQQQLANNGLIEIKGPSGVYFLEIVNQSESALLKVIKQ